jgi:hypothetical protein
MKVDVLTSTIIRRPCSIVAAYAADPNNAPSWYENIKAIRWESSPPMGIGSRLGFEAEFLGRRLAYVYEITEMIPGERLVMRTADGPFPMETTYRWSDADGDTLMSLRNRGKPSGFSYFMWPLMAIAMRRANRKDLERLKSILEANEAVIGHRSDRMT